MSVGFRSFLTVDASPLLATVIAHLDRWSRAKEIGVHAGAPGRYVLDPDDILTIARHEVGGGAVYRWRRLHPFATSPNEIWRTTVTAFEAADGPGWLWTEIEVADGETGQPPKAAFMSVPAVLRTLMPDLPCRDGLVPSSPGPTWVRPGDLPDLMDYLADDTRLGPVYVARQGSREAGAFEAWAREVTWEVVGLGNAFLLGERAEQDFNDMVGEFHAIPNGAIRTYLPGVDLDDAHDPRRHQILGSVRIDRSGPRRLAYIFGLSQRDRGAALALPEAAWRIERMLSAAEVADDYGAAGADLRVVGEPMAGVATGATPPPDEEDARLRPGTLSRRGQHRRLLELLEENDRLRVEIDRLRDALGAHERADAGVLATLEALETEVTSLRRRLGLDASRAVRAQLTAS